MTRKKSLTSIVKKGTIKRTIKKQQPTRKEKIMAKIKDFMFVEQPKIVKTVKIVPVEPSKTTFRHACPYKSFKCGMLELLFGVIIGLSIAIALSLTL